VIIGVNKVFAHNARDYHIQCEDLGVEQATFEVRVYDRGTVLWRKRVPYADIVAKALPKIELEEALRHMMEKTIITVEAAIAKGKLG
jgi:hypothetical protein